MSGMAPALMWLPATVFALLWAAERIFPESNPRPRHTAWDWVLNLSGIFCQGTIIPLAGLAISTRILPALWPEGRGILPLGYWGAFLFNFVIVDFLYYWQHRWFHQAPWLWRLHLCHHASRRVDLWATSRNSLLIHFLFVYFLLNPVFAYLCDEPLGYFCGAALTASLDLLRHSRMRLHRLSASRPGRWLAQIFISPCAHHRHHALGSPGVNYGANFILWDRLFGTADATEVYPARYGLVQAPPPLAQLLSPLASGRTGPVNPYLLVKSSDSFAPSKPLSP